MFWIRKGTVVSVDVSFFQGLTPQELKQLKEAINAEDEERVEELVASNPRYLLSPCDTPSVLHSGTRANALHVAAAKGSLRSGALQNIAEQNIEGSQTHCIEALEHRWAHK